MGKAGSMPDNTIDKILFLLQQFLNPWIMSGFMSAFLASLAWMAAMTRFNLNYAYPFMSLAFIIVMLFSVIFLRESLTLQSVLGTSPGGRRELDRHCACVKKSNVFIISPTKTI